MKMRPLLVSTIIALLLATGCATVTFKRGAGPGGAKADEDTCRATSESQAAYVACLRERGWMVGGKDAESATKKRAASAPAAPPAAQPAPIPAKPSTAAQPEPAGAPVKSKDMTPPAASEPAKPTPPTRAGYPDPEEPAAEEAPLEPTAKINVSSWWKVGGTAADLDRAVAACVDELGATHEPNPAITEVTVALKDCLRAKKWIAVGGTGPL